MKPTPTEAAKVIGTRGGSVKSPKKAAAARLNGKKGGYHTHRKNRDRKIA